MGDVVAKYGCVNKVGYFVVEQRCGGTRYSDYASYL